MNLGLSFSLDWKCLAFSGDMYSGLQIFNVAANLCTDLGQECLLNSSCAQIIWGQKSAPSCSPPESIPENFTKRKENCGHPMKSNR